MLFGATKIFTPEKIKEVINLRKMGYPYSVLAKKYKVDHTTIIYHCRDAGISLRRCQKKIINSLLSQGASAEKISEILKIPLEAAEYHISMFKIAGDRLYSKMLISSLPPLINKPIIKKINITKKQRKKRVKKILVRKIRVVEGIAQPLIKTDSRGVEWMSNGKGGWVCAGRTQESLKREAEEKKKRELELKRRQMLKY